MTMLAFNRRGARKAERVALVVDADGSRTVVSRDVFLRDNRDDAHVVRAVRALKPGDSVSFGGGAMPHVRVTRLRSKRSK